MTDNLFLKHDSSIFRQSSNPVCGFSMMEQVRLCAVWPTENCLGSSMNHMQGWRIVLNMLQPCFEKGMSGLSKCQGSKRTLVLLGIIS